MADSAMIRVLSIDGGGIRGYLPALILAEIERRAAQPIVQLFDLIVGTSTGGIIGIGAAAGLRASALAEFYPRFGGKIFGRPDQSDWKNRLLGGGENFADRMNNAARTMGAYAGGNARFGGNARHKPDGLESVLSEMLGATMLSQAALDLAVTSFDGLSATPVVFSRHDARNDHAYDLPLRDVARATSAAPTFFPPLEKHWAGAPRRFIDGGVWANNPGGVAVAESLRLTSDRGLTGTSVYLVSLGTGAGEVREGFSGISTWIGSAKNLISTATSVREGEVLIERAFPPQRIARLQVIDSRIAGAMDDPSPDRLRMLEAAANGLITGKAAEIDRIVAHLVQH